jgi:hypothetical protein
MTFARNRLLKPAATLAAFALPVFLVGAHPFTPGVTYKMRMVMSMPQMPGMSGDMIIVGHGIATNNHSRLDVDSGGGGPMAPFSAGDFLLTLDSGRVLLVNPATKTYVDGFTMGGGGLPPEIMAQASISGVVVNIEKLGAGDTIEGRPTQKYRMTSQYTVNIMGNSVSIGGEAEMLTAELPTKINSPFGGGMPKSMSTGPFAELYNKMLDATKQVSGSVVRVNNVMSINGPMSMNMTQTMQLTDVKAADIDEKQLQVPDGYTARPPGS